MRKKYALSFLIGLIAFFLLSSCGADNILFSEKELFISKDQFKKEGISLEDVFYSSEDEKLALSFRTSKRKKFMRFYDFLDEKPAFYFQTEEADDVFPPSFGKDLSISYGLLEGQIWKVWETLFLPRETRELVSLEMLTGLAFDYQTRSVFVTGKQKEKTGIFPAPFPESDFRLVDNLFFTPEYQIGFRALKPDNSSWIVYANGKESESFTYISSLAFDSSGRLGYVARDNKDNWYTILDNQKTKLQKKYQQIAKVDVADKNLIFAGMQKDAGTWDIISNDTVLVSGLLDIPDFVVLHNRKIAYKEGTNEGVRFYDGNTFSPFFSQVDQLAEDGNGNLFAKIKNQFGLWQVISGDIKSDQYVLLSKIFKNPAGQVFFLGMTSSGDLEIFKFRNK